MNTDDVCIFKICTERSVPVRTFYDEQNMRMTALISVGIQSFDVGGWLVDSSQLAKCN